MRVRRPTAVLACVAGFAAQSAAIEHPPTVLNTTGKAITLPMPVRTGTAVAGEVLVTIDETQAITVAATDLSGLLVTELADPARNALAELGPTPLPLNAFRSIKGLSVTFNHQAMELVVRVDAETSKARALSFTHTNAPPELREPAAVSAFLNYALTFNQDWSQAGHTGITLDLEAATRVGGIVFETEAAVGGSLSGFLCPLEAQCRDQDNTTVRRLGSRAVYDMADWETRAVLGDTTYWGLQNQRSADVLGFTLAHNPEIFAKRPNHAKRSFNEALILHRPADVSVLLNGIPMQRLTLQPGTYSLMDLPLSTGANTIEAVVTYENGEQVVYDYSTLANHQLLDAGAVTWGVTGGLPSVWKNGERHYLDMVQAAGNIRYGLTHTLTGYLTADTDGSVHTAGGGAHALTPIGTIHLGGTASFSVGNGYAASFAYESLPDRDNPRRHFRLAADYTSDAFRQPGDTQLLLGDLIYPTFDSWLKLTAFASYPLAWESYLTATARYDFAAERPNLPGAVSANIDRWNVDVGIARQLFETTTVSVTAGYGNDRLLSFSKLREDPEFRVGLSLHTRFGDTTISGRHSFGNDVSTVSASHLARTPSETWHVTVTADHAPERGQMGTASVGHFGQRGETILSHTAQSPPGFDHQHRTQLQHRGALAFADGKVAIGAPVRGGFAIVAPHDSIPDADVLVGNSAVPRATGTAWFPAIVNDLPAYSPVQYPLDATGIPDGYALGSAVLSVQSPYRAGYAVELGSGNAVTAFGTLLDANGDPLGLQAGHATSEDHPGITVTVFTNSSGRFAAEGVGHGAWTIAMPGTLPLTYSLTVPAVANGLHNADILHPIGIVTVPEPDRWQPTIMTQAETPR